MKLTKKKKKEIEKAVEKYLKTFEIKDSNGKVTGSNLKNSPKTLLTLYKEKFFLELENDEERFFAKTLFKEALPYKEWREYISRQDGELARQIEDFQEMIDPKYNRKTPRREEV